MRMTGQVVQLHCMLPVTVLRNGQPDIAIDFVVDTGFTGFLTLPVQAVNLLELPFIEEIFANLATDDIARLDVHAATIVWKGIVVDVRVIATGRRPLLGTALLDGSEFLSQFVEGGLVTVDDV